MPDWTEKYRPATLGEVRGNDKARDELREWAESWPGRGRAIVLSGSPGVGKTSAAHALAADMGWDAVEVNASDSRRKDDIERLVGRASVNQGLDGALQQAKHALEGNTDTPRSNTRQLLIIDEADSFHGNADRGGTRALSSIVNNAEQPMVLIVNDEYEMPDGLRRNLDIIEFRDVSARSILPVLRDICRREDIEYDSEALELIADKNAGDLRGAINDLQAIAEQREVLRVDDVVTGDRDRTKGIFEFLDAVIKEATPEAALRASYDVDETPDDLISWIEDNVPKDYDGAELAVAYDFLGDADKWLGRVRATQNYSYWRYATDTMTAGVAAARREPKGGWTRYGPPSYWRRLGASRSAREKRDYVARQIAAESGTSIATARRVIVPYLAAMTHHCTNRALTVAMTAAYDLEAEHVAFVTGSGQDTNKVQSIVEDASELRDSALADHADGAFDAPAGAADGGTETDGPKESANDASDEATNEQADFSDFG